METREKLLEEFNKWSAETLASFERHKEQLSPFIPREGDESITPSKDFNEVASKLVRGYVYEQYIRPHTSGGLGGMRYRVVAHETGIISASVYPSANLNPNINITRTFTEDRFEHAVEWCKEQIRDYVDRYGHYGMNHAEPKDKA